MKKLCALLVVLSALAMPVMAGEKGTCTGNAKDCLAAMKAKYAQKGWLGIEYDTDDQGHWVVTKVYDGSPAQVAGFQDGDILLAVNDVKYSQDNKQQLKAVYSTFKPGAETTYLVTRDGEKVKLEATLGSVPKDIQEQWIAEHMKKNHPDFKMAAK
jgi:S1-C subfamily serine protease